MTPPNNRVYFPYTSVLDSTSSTTDIKFPFKCIPAIILSKGVLLFGAHVFLTRLEFTTEVV